ncbi:MAG: murein biosynthesis integral membrane protein MurJ [Patescibacteria group bacterium]
MFEKVWTQGRKILTQRQPKIHRAAAFIMVTVLASKALGLVRDRLLASFFGAQPDLGVFWAAVEIPDTIFYILGSAVFSASFIPVFTSYLGGSGESVERGQSDDARQKEGWVVAGTVLNLALLCFSVLGFVLLFFSKPISRLVAPGFSKEEIQLMSGLVRVMTGAQFFFVLSYFLTGILHSFQRFLLPALASVFYNFGVILGIVALAPRFGVWGPAWGMVFGSFLHFVVQLPLAYSLGFSWQSVGKKLFHLEVRRVFKLMVPRAIALLGGKMSSIIQISLASLVPTIDSVSNVAVLTFARHLKLLPVALFGMSISEAALPVLSRHTSAKEANEFRDVFKSSLQQTLFLAAPAAVILLVLRIPAVRLAFGAKRFSWKATILTGYAVAFFSLEVVFQAVLYLLNRAFYALEEAKTPVKITLFFSALGISLAALFTRVIGWGVWAIPLALSFASAAQTVVQFIFLERKLGKFDRVELLAPLSKIGWSAFFSGVFLYIPMKLLDKLVFDTTRVIGLFLLTGTAAFSGLVVYLCFTYIFNVRECRQLTRLIFAQFRGRESGK